MSQYPSPNLFRQELPFQAARLPIAVSLPFSFPLPKSLHSNTFLRMNHLFSAFSFFLSIISQNQEQRLELALLHCMLSLKNLRLKLRGFPEGTGKIGINRALLSHLALAQEHFGPCTKLLLYLPGILDAPLEYMRGLIFRCHLAP